MGHSLLGGIMNRLALVVAFIASISAHGMEVEEFYDINTGDVSALIKNPTHHGSNLPHTGFSVRLSENGICKSLGYEKAAPVA
jgi:hypothetical protein